MQKLDLQTPDLTEANITKIAQLFPHVVTEAEDEEGNLVKKVDFDKLRQELSKDIVEDTTERYRLDRPGKKRSILKANTPITKTLRPVPGDSVNWDTTENLYLEGDNFEILKILQESYLGKIKMIYIDPPYNTGKDFVYKDNFTKEKSDYEGEIGAVDEEGGKLFKNTDTNGRYHSDWLSMMYSRLTIARDLLKDDGVIFISIDDNEVHNLRKICDEIFGEENFVDSIIRKTKSYDRDKSSREFQKIYDTVLVFSKNNELLEMKQIITGIKEYPLSDEIGSYKLNPLQNRGPNGYRDRRPKTYYPIYISQSGDIGLEKNREDDMEIFPDKIGGKDGTWSRSKDKIINENKRVLVKNNKLFIKIYEDKDKDNNKYVSEQNMQLDFPNSHGSSIMTSLGMQDLFSNPKPIDLIKWCINLSTSPNDTVFDFFSGSSSTAHAVMQLNAEDGGNRKFIVAQLPEEISTESDAYKAGYKYITEIGKERIRRAGKKILEENKDTLAQRETPLDIGFRVYKTDTSNMKDVYYHPSQISQEKLGLFVSNVKDDRTPEDLLTQVMLDLGLTLDLSIEEKKIKGNKVFFVAGNSLVACFDEKIDFAIVDEIAESQPLKVVFRDSSFADDKDRINVETRMKRLSPETTVSVI